MEDVLNDETDDDTTVGGDEPKLTKPVYVYTGPQIIADSKMRLAEWLERRGW